MRSYFWPFTEVQNGNQREVMTKCGNFFRPEETKGREDSIWFHTSESSLRSLRLLSLPAVAGESLRSCLLLQGLLRRAHLRLRSAMARRLDDCRGSRVGCFREIAGGTPATTALLWREGGDVHTKKRF